MNIIVIDSLEDGMSSSLTDQSIGKDNILKV